MKFDAFLIFLLFISPTLCAQQSSSNTTSVPYVLVPYRIKNQWGFSDKLGNIKIKPVYDGVIEMEYYWTDGNEFKNLMIVTKGSEKFVINHLNQVVVPANKGYDSFELDSYSYETVIAEKSKKKALYYDGKELLPCVYDDIDREANLSFKITRNNLRGLINSTGKVVVPQKFVFLGFKDIIANKITWAARNNIMDKPEIFEDQKTNDTIPRYHSLGATKLRSTYNLLESDRGPNKRINLDSAGIILKPNYQNLRSDDQHPHLVYMEKNGKKGLYNAILQKIVIPCEYDEIVVCHPFSAEIIIFVKKGLYGFMGEWGNVIVPPIFEAVYGKELPYTLVKGKQVGMLTKSIHYIKPMYKSIKYFDAVYDLKAKSNFSLFEVETLTGKKGLINGEGFEYFKD